MTITLRAPSPTQQRPARGRGLRGAHAVDVLPQIISESPSLLVDEIDRALDIAALQHAHLADVALMRSIDELLVHVDLLLRGLGQALAAVTGAGR